ncbi:MULTISPECIES: type II secretion system minor pseudopilin GspK [unclassified Pseudomonas]|uniref:type II secretion system minor pseudopilin GspK n=1 Tax=unclassified Pseudomonas TaxID=196821 RepID=UPI000DAA8B2D|nr:MULTISPECIES: type II secretion system minor pseudopilin GspK [unclassified Pseudomonas]MDW3716148.1 type II secretion system minor pseudopilin GspK [Pseudomonas sp. 2023EL-01195]PZE13076.1 general secretion pathway protein GspK [Pseudomonas sp. 57B-090624]
MTRQRGVALVTVLLVVSIVTVICAGLILRQQLSIRGAANRIAIQQAWHYALGGEALGQSVLLRDLKKPGSDPRAPIDHPLEDWARPLPVFPIDQGEIGVHIEDLAGRFNLNSLVQGDKVDKLSVERFNRLLLRLKIEKPYADRLVDWLDKDQEPSGEYGAEDNQYLLAQPPYRTAGRELQDVSELRLLLDMSEEDYRLLAPWVSTLPAKVPLNVNTASPLVLSCLADNLDPAAAQSLLSGRGREGYPDIRAFLDQPAMAGTGVRAAGLGVGSAYFQVRSEVRLGERKVVLLSTLQRDPKGVVRVLKRDLGQPGYLAQAPLEPQEE